MAAVYLGALEWNIRVYCGSTGAKLRVGLHALRLLGMAAMLGVIARTASAAALLVTIGGFEAARMLMVGSMALRIGKFR